MRSRVLCGLTLGACLVAARPAVAEVPLLEKDGWTFFTNGRVNVFLSQGIGDDFPNPTLNTNLDINGNPGPQHTVVGSGQPFNAGYYSDQVNPGNPNGSYRALRIRSGFLGSILAFGVRRQVTDTTTATAFISLWATAQTFGRDRVTDSGNSDSKAFDVREGFVAFEGPSGTLVAGRQSGILGSISTEIDFLYGHNYGLGLPCLDVFFPACGHIGTGALSPGNAAGFTYSTPSLAGFKLRAGLYDPVRLLGAWERVPYPRPEAALTFERKPKPNFMFKLQVEGMYQYVGIRRADRSDQVWGVAGGARVEAGPLRFGVSAFRGKGLGAYIALQNAGSVFSGPPFLDLRYFTGLYAQAAVVFGAEQVSFGAGRVIDDQLAEDKVDPTTSWLKAQTGVSVAFYHHLSDNVTIGIDYFRFQADWWGAPNSTNGYDAMGNPTGAMILPGVLKPEKQVIHFINAGVTFHW